MSALWLGDKEVENPITEEEQKRLELAEAKAWLTIFVLAVVFALGLIIGSQINAPH